MTRGQLEHIIRAAGAITNERKILVLGSQSILGTIPVPPAELTVSTEADVCPIDAADKADLISGAIGELTHFQGTFGYYAHGLPPSACSLPKDWEKRLVPISNPNTNGFVGLCISPLDLTCAKLAAGRPKDVEFAAAMLSHGFVSVEQLTPLIELLPVLEHRVAAQGSLAVAGARALRLAASQQVPTPGIEM